MYNRSIKLFLLFLSIVLISCGKQSQPADSDSADNIFNLSLGSALPGDTVLSIDGGYGDCTISAGFDEITYIKTDIAYTGTDTCEFVDSSCSYGFQIDFSAPTPELTATSANCGSY